MARPLRTNLPGGWYHVTSRGQNRQPIYLDVADGANFMERVQEFPARFGVEVHGFVLMPNHYHLILRTPRGNLSHAVQWLNTGYSIWWNRRHERVGHVFQGRFKSILVEEGRWLLELSLYLHLNPVAVKRLALDKRGQSAERHGAAEPSRDLVAARLDTLRGWKWSSYRAYAGLEMVPDWLTVADIMGRTEGGVEGYRRLAESRAGMDSESPWSHVHWGLVLGEADFAESVRRGLTPGRETGTHRLHDPALSWSDIVSWVEKRRGLTWVDMCARRGEWGRELAWWAGRRWAEMSLRQLGEQANGVDYAAVAKALERFVATGSKDAERASAMADLEAHFHLNRSR